MHLRSHLDDPSINVICVTDECSYVVSSRREIAQRHPGNKKTVYYRTPCNKRLVRCGRIAYLLKIVWKKMLSIGNLLMLNTVLISSFVAFFRGLCSRWLATVSRKFSSAVIPA